jgi:hypothetical protein
MSGVEAVANVVVGLVVAVATQIVVFPVRGLEPRSVRTSSWRSCSSVSRSLGVTCFGGWSREWR